MGRFLKLQNSIKQQLKDTNIIILIGTTVAVFLLLSFTLGDKFFSAANFQSMAFQIPEFGFMSLGMALCIIAGGIDLSIVAVANLSSVVAGFVMLGIINMGGSVWLAIWVALLAGIVVGALCGLINGFMIVKANIVPILCTLSTMIFYNGVIMVITQGRTVTGFPIEFAKMGVFTLSGIPATFILFLVIAIILALILSATYFGRNVYLFGENRTVSLFSGLKINTIVLKTYTLSGLLAGIGGLILITRVFSARIGYGDTYLLQALLVCILGGLSWKGGKGKIAGVLLGILVLQMLQSGFTLLGIEPHYKNFIWGVVIVVVMITNYYIERNRRKIRPIKVEIKDN